jgi:hypothetical protein
MWLPAITNSGTAGTLAILVAGGVQPQTGSNVQFNLDSSFSVVP